ncbi:YgaP family membrane protein [Priestia megaterium]|uniref:YgaP family membrane protein n=1 Tax=Priestia megaterium TaxID=1404 RepID=UPI00237A01E2|nr:DUF2892 domain-containing protein [Priestia megaterium]
MKPNIGIVNALIRLTLGFTLLSWTTSRLSRRPYKDSSIFLGLMGALKVAEGITRFCPLRTLMIHVKNTMNMNTIQMEMKKRIILRKVKRRA